MSTATSTPPMQPFAAIYRAVTDHAPAEVRNAIERLRSSGKTFAVKDVRAILDTAPCAPAPVAVTPRAPIACSDAEITKQRLCAIRERLPRKILHCLHHPGLTAAEEAAYQRGRQIVVAYGYLPSANMYEADSC